ncbi:MAG: type I secretion system permease/ATPase [Gammaproteobacteria bacterium]|nr:type I secretion system permease/ATPase [Gammaproteobacteria bacterium]
MPHSADTERRPDTGLLSLAIIARVHGLPADAEQLRHRFGPPGEAFGTGEILRAARYLGLRAREVTTTFERLAKTPLPAVARHQDGHYFVLARVDGDKALIQDPLESRPLALPQALFEAAWSGTLILLTRRAAVGDAGAKFGFKWFLPALVKYRRLFAEVLIASFFLQLFALITPLFFQVVIDKVLVHKGLTTLDVLAFGLLVVSLFEVVLGGLRTYLFAHTANRIDVLLGAKLFGHLLALPLAYFEARRVGDSVARVRELETVRAFITGSALTVVIDLLFTVVFLAVMYYYSPLLTWIVLGAIPGYVLLSVCVTPILRARVHEKFNRGAENQAFLVESVSGIETLKAMAVEPQMQRRWEEQLAGYVHASFKAGNLNNIANQLAGFINKAVVVLILWVGARAVITGHLSVGQLIAFNMLAARVSGPVLRLVQLWQDFQQAGVSVQRLGDILDTPTEPACNQTRSSLPQLAGRITFDRVTFRYRPAGAEVLRNLTLEIPAGQVIGIVGRSGSGKSTLAKLAQRLYVPEAGRVLVDGVDLAMVDTAWLRHRVGVVLQENTLFNRSVRDNIALSDPGLPMAAIVQAATLAGAHAFILEMPQGYDTLVGEHGATLSGGQRQRLAIARALVTQPRVLILDEATSALDYESERILQQNMRAICRGRTVIIIAHRLSTVRHTDRIVVLEHGRIVEQGCHDELVKRAGQYARLWALQSGEPAMSVSG